MNKAFWPGLGGEARTAKNGTGQRESHKNFIKNVGGGSHVILRGRKVGLAETGSESGGSPKGLIKVARGEI